MRIAPDSPSLSVDRPSAAAASPSEGFADALTSARNSSDPSLGAWTDKSLANQTPPAQRWGQWGAGASAEGFGPPPDPSEFSQFPVGPDAPASPLNSSGVTTTPSFTVPGYTARGTPIAPGFYNLAYYNWYLREGGTPLPGFPLHEAGATLTETYGSFGDGAERATSFVTATAGDGGGNGPDGGGTPTTDAGGATGVLTGAIHAGTTDGAASAAAARVSATLARLEAASSGSGAAASSAPARAAASASVARPDVAANASAEEQSADVQSAERDATAADASATETDGATALRAATRDLQTLGKTELAALLGDLLRNV